MKVAVFSSKPYDRDFLGAANRNAGGPHELLFLDVHLDAATAALAGDARAVCAFVNDRIDAQTVQALARQGVGLIALRCAGFNNVDLASAAAAGIKVARVPAYSPHAVAEHALALILSLNRKTYRAHARVREGNFALDGLLGFDLKDKIAGIVGAGRIGLALARILAGFGCRVIASDPVENPELSALGGRYVALEELIATSDIISLHCPLTDKTRHLIDGPAIARMKRGVMLINTSRGAVLDTRAIIRGLKDGTIGNLGLDVYEEEDSLFFEDQSNRLLLDDVFARLLTFPNVLITGHQGFFTREAMEAIAATTIENISAFERSGTAKHEVAAHQEVVDAADCNWVKAGQ
jgi:D-lactate dehydrogenase